MLIKAFRHIKTNVVSLTHDFIDQCEKKVRNMFPVLILYQGIPEERIKEVIWKSRKDRISYEELEAIY